MTPAAPLRPKTFFCQDVRVGLSRNICWDLLTLVLFLLWFVQSSSPPLSGV